VLALAGVTFLTAATAASAHASASRFSIPTSARQLIVVSSQTYDPRDYIASFRSFQRPSAGSPWQPVFPVWQAEIGSGELRNVRREGDHATPTGVYAFGPVIYGNEPNPRGLHEAYHQLVCGDWWDEDPYSADYNRFVHVSCQTTPVFAGLSEALWTETSAYPYFAVIEYNEDPTVSGPQAPGSGIFLHAWVRGPTEGCVALHIPDLLHVLRWLQPADHPVIEIGTDAELGSVPPAPSGEPRRALKPSAARASASAARPSAQAARPSARAARPFAPFSPAALLTPVWP
jgi:L,D-peptidoglycan transpeptidase YkuD (ErfK/YbiS/YcfS/YnhG family)